VSAVKRGVPNPLIDDVALCVQLGWTHEMLMGQPTRFVERTKIYLNTICDAQRRENQRLEDEFHRRTRRNIP